MGTFFVSTFFPATQKILKISVVCFNHFQSSEYISNKQKHDSRLQNPKISAARAAHKLFPSLHYTFNSLETEIGFWNGKFWVLLHFFLYFFGGTKILGTLFFSTFSNPKNNPDAQGVASTPTEVLSFRSIPVIDLHCSNCLRS